MKSVSPPLLLSWLCLLVNLQAADALSLAQRLGYAPADRLVIINADDSGMCHSANLAVIDGFETGLLTSATIMVPCPWFNEIAEFAQHRPQADLGLHLTHTSEWTKYRWGPVAPPNEVPGLIDPQGYLWRSVEEVYAHATPAEAFAEAHAQIRKALKAGIDVTHLDSHMGTLQYNAQYMEVYLKLAREFDLPVRMASQTTLEKFGQPNLRARFAEAGILFPDYFVFDELKDESADVKAFWIRILKNLKPGVTELYIHPAKPEDELKAITATWRTRSSEADAFTRDPDIRTLLQTENIIRIGYRPIRDLQRRLR